jgi:hypothetical protein
VWRGGVSVVVGISCAGPAGPNGENAAAGAKCGGGNIVPPAA